MTPKERMAALRKAISVALDFNGRASSAHTLRGLKYGQAKYETAARRYEEARKQMHAAIDELERDYCGEERG